jgi:hypothetical protein
MFIEFKKRIENQKIGRKKQTWNLPKKLETQNT